MAPLKRAVRNGLVAGLVAGFVAGLVSRDSGAALTSAVVAGGGAWAGSYLLGESLDLEEEHEGPVEFDA
ncbi:MAG: hypothetical protein V5A24_00675 [Haloarculaceae archaeon]